MVNKVLSEFMHEDQLVRLTFNAPKANVLDAEMMADLQAELENLRDKPEVKLIQLTGAGDHFSFGASVPEHTRENAPQMLRQFHLLFYTLADLAIPTMALISGQCLGGGMELALMCNFIMVDKTAKLGQPEINLGVFAPPASFILPLKLGQARADCLLLSGRIMSAEEGINMGLAMRLCEHREEMLNKAENWVEKFILPKSASSLRFAVKASRMKFNELLRNQLSKLELYYLDELMATHDANEGINSFLEKRKPEWKNS